MRIIGIVTARGGSKRIPDKNICHLNGRPLLHYCLMAAKACSKLNRLIVSTDNDKIAAEAMKLNVEVMERPSELARDNTASVDVIQHVIKTLKKQGDTPDVVLTIQPTYPFVSTKNFDDVIDAFFQSGNFDSVITVSKAPFHYHPYNARVVNEDGTVSFMFPEKKKKCPNSQSAPDVYYFGNLIGTKAEVVLKKGSLYGDRSIPILVDFIESFDIDDPSDLKIAEILMRARQV